MFKIAMESRKQVVFTEKLLTGRENRVTLFRYE